MFFDGVRKLASVIFLVTFALGVINAGAAPSPTFATAEGGAVARPRAPPDPKHPANPKINAMPRPTHPRAERILTRPAESGGGVGAGSGLIEEHGQGEHPGVA
jgi:hypothetical protein